MNSSTAPPKLRNYSSRSPGRAWWSRNKLLVMPKTTIEKLSSPTTYVQFVRVLIFSTNVCFPTPFGGAWWIVSEHVHLVFWTNVLFFSLYLNPQFSLIFSFFLWYRVHLSRFPPSGLHSLWVFHVVMFTFNNTHEANGRIQDLKNFVYCRVKNWSVLLNFAMYKMLF